MAAKTNTKTPRHKREGGKSCAARKPRQKDAKKSSAPRASSKKLRATALARGLQPRVRLGDAMRVGGLDEMGAARAMRRFIGAVSREKPNRKLLLEALKEVFRVLEPVRTADRAPADAPVHVQLIHYVARPRESQPPVDAREVPPASTPPPAV